MYCRFCGAPMRDDAVQCMACGAYTREYEEQLKQAEIPTTPMARNAVPRPGAAPTPGGTPYAAPTPGGTPYAAPTPGGTPYTAPTPGGTPYAAPTPGGTPYAPPTRGGTPYTPPTPAPAPADPATGGAKKKPKKTHGALTMRPRLLLCLVIAAIIGCGAFSWLLGAMLPPQNGDEYRESMEEDYGEFESVIDEYVAYAYNDDEESARELFCESFRDDDLSRHGWAVIPENAETYELTDVSLYTEEPKMALSVVVGEQVDAALDVEVTIEFDDDTDDQIMDIILVSVDDTWYVYDVM